MKRVLCNEPLTPTLPYIYMRMKTFALRLGGTLLCVGAVMPALGLKDVAPYVFALGALLFCPIQMSERHDEEESITIRRLRRQQMLGSLLLLVTAALMLTAAWNIPPFRRNEWMMTLTIGAVLELYSAFRLPR